MLTAGLSKHARRGCLEKLNNSMTGRILGPPRVYEYTRVGRNHWNEPRRWAAASSCSVGWMTWPVALSLSLSLCRLFFFVAHDSLRTAVSLTIVPNTWIVSKSDSNFFSLTFWWNVARWYFVLQFFFIERNFVLQFVK